MKLAEILKDVPSGTKMYSPFLGDVEFVEVALNGETPSCIHIRKEYKGEKNYWLNPDGTFLNGEECMLYPSKDCRDWSMYIPDPMFEIGDLVEDIHHFRYRIIGIENYTYIMGDLDNTRIPFTEQNSLHLAKFDISELKPFDKVLVRNTNTECWRISLFGCFSNEERYFMCLANCAFYQCIPYDDDTQHLLGRVIDAPKFYKTW